jgi:hypothetical protein
MEIPIHDKEKTDVFILGIILIYAASLQSMDCCFDFYHAWFLDDKAEEKLQVIKTQYHDNLFYLLKDMINKKENERPNF